LEVAHGGETCGVDSADRALKKKETKARASIGAELEGLLLVARGGQLEFPSLPVECWPDQFIVEDGIRSWPAAGGVHGELSCFRHGT
jgi:hypothetical protein